MKSFLKNNLVNNSIILLACIILYVTLNYLFNIYLVYLFAFLMSFAYAYEYNSTKNKEYHFSNIYKIIYTLCCFANCLYIAFFKTGWDVLGILGVDIILIFAVIYSFLTRLIFRIFYKQKFNLKINTKQTILLIVLTIITLVLPIVIINL